VRRIEHASETQVVAILQGETTGAWHRLTIELDPSQPNLIVKSIAEPIAPPDEFLTPEDFGRGAGPLDAPRRRSLIDGIAKELEAHYVFPDLAARMITVLRDRAAHGDYDAIARGDAFARTLTHDLHEASHDLHLEVVYGPKPPPRRPRDPAPSILRHVNFGFGPIERMEGNVARLTINGFFAIEDVRDAIPGIMSQVADADALVIDVRANRGGAPETIALVASYLFDALPVHLSAIFWRDGNRTERFCTHAEVQGARFGAKKPIYVLTSKQTFSGAEALAYDLQSLKRALIVGETTGGGAHPSRDYPLDEWFDVAIPIGRAINPVTKTNWERVGVVPDVPVSADAAPEEAHRRAPRSIAASSPPASQSK
jgi:hypothetical protein